MRCEHDFIDCAGREVHVRIWNRSAEETVVCWHGLARTGADFLELAETLAEQGYRVLAPDTIGRGLSQWAEDGAQEYQMPNYVAHVLAILDHYGIKQLKWVGTSMGGLLGMVLASTVLADRIERLVINDIGPEIPLEALIRINSYVNDFPDFPSLTAFEERIRVLYAPFGERTEAQWHQMAIDCSRRKDNGKFVVHYDPAIGAQFDPSKPVPTLWELFDQIRAKMMLVHGLQSDVLPLSIVNEMRARNPGIEYLGIDGCGHAPGLHCRDHIEPIRSFLSGA